MKQPKLIDDVKSVREKGIKEILNNLLSNNCTGSSAIERSILIGILVNDKTFSELSKTNELTKARQKVILENGIKRINNFLSIVNDKLENYTSLEKELQQIKKKLSIAEEKTQKLSKLTPQQKKVLALPIYETNLSQRVKNICDYAQLKYISDLAKLSKIDFLRFRNSGKTSLSELEDFFDYNKLVWSMQL